MKESVSIQYKGELQGSDREERRQSLLAEFAKVAGIFKKHYIDIDDGKLSVSEQTVEAYIPRKNFSEAASELKGKKFDLRLNPTICLL